MATTSYNNDKVVTGEVEYPAVDPASGAFFQPDYKKNDDLKMMLDSSKDSLKLEAMKRIIGMIAKGRDASDLFPAVVKNVVSKNIEVKKLVYVYLVRYAEEQQDLALLSISTFQRALKDPNQLIRASALRVLSSIRVNMIVPIVMLAIRDSASDMSPYVRKTAAHAIPKLYSLDPEQKEELVSVIDKLLSDKAPLVVGSAAMAFMEVCPERMSLIHRSYRKLCSLLVDVDEWGQLVLLNMLTIYAKSYFPNPNSDSMELESEEEKPFYEDTDSDASSTNEDEAKKKQHRKSSQSPTLDPDHKLLLRAARPLLQSRNAGVVMAVAQIYYHCGPVQDLPPVAKAMVRLLRAPSEVQSVVLHSIASLTIFKRSLFEPFLKSFFVRMSDPTHIKLLKLEILTNLATESTAPVILREFQTYVTSSDKTFAGATIQSIGRLAANIESVTETCLNGLLQLLSSKDEWVVCEAVVVVKRVVGGGASSAWAAVSRAARLLRSDRLAPRARAAAVWLLAEHGAAHARAASILAHMATDFADQDELVKLQVLTLAVKLSITRPETLPLSRYVLTLARYDTSYDVRDRARLLRRFVEDGPAGGLRAHAAAVFLARKPAPVMESKFKDRQHYTLGTLSHYVGVKAGGYIALPASPAAAEGARAREPAPPAPAPPARPAPSARKDKSFYSEPESSGDGSTSSAASSSGSEDSSAESSNSGTSDSDSDSDSSSPDDNSDSEQSSSSANEALPEKNNTKSDKRESKPPSEAEPVKKDNEKSNLELLLELDEVASSLPTMTPTCGGLLTPSAASAPGAVDDEIVPCGAAWAAGAGAGAGAGAALWAALAAGGAGARGRWARAPHLYSPRMAALEVTFTNHSAADLANIRVHKKTLTGSRAIHDFAPIPLLEPGASASTTMGVDFADTIQPVEFTVMSSLGEVSASITPPVGELMRAVTMSETRWDTEQKKLRGMNECTKKAPCPSDEKTVCQRVYETANVGAVTSTGNYLRFSARMLSSQDLVLLSIKLDEHVAHVTVNCSNMAIASMLTNDIANSF